eukprot:CAMPEP_0202956522 /NCGR_PEP_ID=MMETSP1396-20130829/1023_1 /ASSEMBLY_ACC=CAM_ASM_000872 /TAXON_ID= /ORGANISM="Pseudokeronopsis sp., Strain Brazil" /LENGTH=121 /DNA_ID=CAMNT_0049673581 /DNA_START=74 /DNA_END=439 /DNA_ORIENTATION=+
MTMFILVGDSSICYDARLDIALWLCFSIQASTFLLLLFHYIGLGACLMKMGKVLGFYYFYMVGAMFAVQVIFFKGTNCSIQSPLSFFWIAGQIFIFYVFVAYGIALWGAFICFQAEKEEKK